MEFKTRDSAFLDDANLVKAPVYKLIHLNIHYDPGPIGLWRRICSLRSET
jgi:hypothetical protein